MMPLAIMLLLTLVPQLHALDMTEEVRQRILRDEVVASVTEDGGGVGIEATYMIRKPIDVVWALLKDFDFYRKVYKEYESISIASEGPEGMLVDYVMDVSLKKVEYTLLRVYRDESSFNWTLVKGDDFSRLDGEYQLESAGPDLTFLRYKSFIRTKSKVVNFFKDMVAVKQTKKSILKFKVAAEKE
jgi:ribosome-associated toxin RatA of RatAB toxin-antitoxin module